MFPTDRYRCSSFRYWWLHLIMSKFDFLWQPPAWFRYAFNWWLITIILYNMLSCFVSELMLLLLLNSWGAIVTSNKIKHILSIRPRPLSLSISSSELLRCQAIVWTRLVYCYRDHWKHIFMKFERKYKICHTGKLIWKCLQIAAPLPRRHYVYKRLQAPRIS